MKDCLKRFTILAIAAMFLSAAPAAAQDWPTKPVRIIVPFGPGSTPDIVVRLIADHLQQKHGQPFTVENKPGASGNTGTDAVAKAEPDGSTIGISIGGPLAINTLLFSKLPYNPKTDLVPITQLVTQPSALAVNSNVKVNDAAELLTTLKRETGRFSYASIGNGSLSHLAMEAINQITGTRMVHVPYAGSGPAMIGLLGGQVPIMFLPVINAGPHIAAGKLRGIAVTSRERLTALPELPTIAESGLAGYQSSQWYGVLAPAGTPQPIVRKIHAETVKALAQPDVRAKLTDMGMDIVGSTPEQLSAVMRVELPKWAKVVKESGAKVE